MQRTFDRGRVLPTTYYTVMFGRLWARKNTRCLVTKSNSKAFTDYIVYTERWDTKQMTAARGAELISAA